MAERGEIFNRQRASQIINFAGLRFGNITPTDVDGLIDFGNGLFVLLEYKHGDAPLPNGQRLALERLAVSTRVPCYLLVARHNDEGDIDGANAIVSDVFYRGQWYKQKYCPTVKRYVDRLCEKYGLVKPTELLTVDNQTNNSYYMG